MTEPTTAGEPRPTPDPPTGPPTDHPVAARADHPVPEPPAGAAASVTLRGDGGLPWRPVSPRLATARLVVLALVLLVPLVAGVVLALLVSRWLWAVPAVVAVAGLWGAWVIRRQVPAITWVELPDELVIRRGRIFRAVNAVPYGRLQFVDLQSGPLARKLGMATIELHTASPETGGSIPGLPTTVAEELRERLSDRGESQRAGL